MKKFLALLLAVMMLSISAFALAEEAGFDEYELGVEGDLAASKEDSDLHIEVDLTANENPYSFPVDGWVPYLSIDYTIKDLDGNEVLTGSMMPMAASDGPHYGNNIALAEGEYTITLSIKSPAENGYLLHVDDETGVDAKDGFWTEPLEATWTGWKFVKEW